MTRNSKKQSELTILRTVFKQKSFPKYTFSERPDFIIHAKEDFGVEITEYYQDETGARLHNKPGYVDDVLKGVDVHKDDTNKLEVLDKIEYQDKKTGQWIDLGIKGIRQENMSITDRVASLVKRVNEKSTKFNAYNSALDKIDLIVYDGRTALIDGINDGYLRQMLEDMHKRELFRSSPYRNIFLVIPESSGRKTEIFHLK